jgi:hypothetical protein
MLIFFLFLVLDPNYIWISLKAILFLCQSLFAWSFSRFWVLKFFKAHVCLCLLTVLSTSVFQSSYLLVFELLSISVSQSSSLFASKLLSTSVSILIQAHHRSHCTIYHRLCINILRFQVLKLLKAHFYMLEYAWILEGFWILKVIIGHMVLFATVCA